MSRERARSYADRLPPLVPRAEADISHLDDDMADPATANLPKSC